MAQTKEAPLFRAQESDLPLILGRAAEYCDKLSQSVLNFVCREQIEEQISDRQERFASFGGAILVGRERQNFRYVYDYQLIRDRAGHIQENRTLLEDEGKKVQIPEAPLKTHRFAHAYIVMGPLGLLSRNTQADHDYRVVREEKVRGEPAVVIEAVPKPGRRLGHLFGTIWLRRTDAGILKIEWNPSSIQNYEEVEAIASRLKMTPQIIMTSEYAFEKNGIRFPNRYTVKEVYIRGKRGRRFQRSETVVTYDQYKFFTVETEVKF